MKRDESGQQSKDDKATSDGRRKQRIVRRMTRARPIHRSARKDVDRDSQSSQVARWRAQASAAIAGKATAGQATTGEEAAGQAAERTEE